MFHGGGRGGGGAPRGGGGRAPVGGGGGWGGGGGSWGRRNFPGRGFGWGWGLPVYVDDYDDDFDVYEVVNVNGEEAEIEDLEVSDIGGEVLVHHRRRKPYSLVG